MDTVFDNFLGDDTVVWVNFARHSVIKPRHGEEKWQFHEKRRWYNGNLR